MPTRQQQALLSYIEQMREEGFSDTMIENNLLSHQFPPGLISSLMKKHSSHKYHLQQTFIIAWLAVIGVLLLWLAVSTQSPVSLVLLGMFPAILSIGFCVLIIETAHEKHAIAWVFPPLFAALFYGLAYGAKLPLFASMEIEILVALNFLIPTGFLFTLWFLGVLRPKLPTLPQILVPQKQESKQESAMPLRDSEPLVNYIQSIEDKCKALNFVIGRVYSIKKGADDAMRSHLKVEQEWYNEFSKLGLVQIQKEPKKVFDLILKIESRLLVWQRTEIEIFGKGAAKLTNLSRSPDGSDRIIDVMIKNDKDPVLQYYEGGLEFCRKVREQLSVLQKS